MRARLTVLVSAALVLAFFHGRHVNSEGVLREQAVSLVRQFVTPCQPDRTAIDP